MPEQQGFRFSPQAAPSGKQQALTTFRMSHTSEQQERSERQPRVESTSQGSQYRRRWKFVLTAGFDAHVSLSEADHSDKSGDDEQHLPCHSFTRLTFAESREQSKREGTVPQIG